MGTLKIAGKALEYTGRLFQMGEFEDWVLAEGKSLLENLAEKSGRKIFAQARTKSELARSLKTAAQSRPLSLAINAEVKRAQDLLGTVASRIESNEYTAEGRTYLVPRFWYNIEADRHLRQTLANSAELRNLTGGDALREVFFRQLLADLDAAMTGFGALPKRRLVTANDWLVVGYYPDSDWSHSRWKGHYYLFQTAGHEVKRKHENLISEQIDELDRRLGLISSDEKEKIENSWLAATIQSGTAAIPYEQFCTPREERIKLTD